MGVRAWFKRLWRRSTAPPSPAQKERAAPARRSPAGAGPFVEPIVEALGQRYQIGDASPWGARLQCRHAKYAFRDTECYLDDARRRVTVFFDVRLHGADGAEDAVRLVTRLYGEELAAAGMRHTGERPADAHGTVSIEFACEDADPAALVRFIDFYARSCDSFLDTQHPPE